MSDGPTFNLLTASWLPVRRRSGAMSRIRPAELTDGIDQDPIVGFAWPRPDFNAASLEFMIGLLTTAVAPDDEDAWASWWRVPPAPERLAADMAPLLGAFYLDGAGPRFLQDLDELWDGVATEAAALLIDAPGEKTRAENTDLFVKRGATPALGPPAAAMALFTLSAFAPQGGSGHRTSLRGGGPMSTLVVYPHVSRGDTLWARLWANVETAEQVSARSPDGRPQGTIFPWLQPTRTSEKNGGRRTTPNDVHPLQVYWGMPRRIRLDFKAAQGRPCGVTGEPVDALVVGYRGQRYGTDYSEGFRHPLTPHYRRKLADPTRLAVHAQPGGIGYRLWSGFVVSSADGLREPAQTVAHWHGERVPRHGLRGETRLHAFGYDVVSMKARAWVEGEMPLWKVRHADRLLDVVEFVRQVVMGAQTVARQLAMSVKLSRHDRLKDARGDYGFVEERLYRDTEGAFHASLAQAQLLVERETDSDDPTVPARRQWVAALEAAALRLFDEYAPWEGLEGRNMERHVRARNGLSLVLRGYGAKGRQLFETRLDIPAPKKARGGAAA